jgi:hypothetical protein
VNHVAANHKAVVAVGSSRINALLLENHVQLKQLQTKQATTFTVKLVPVEHQAQLHALIVYV